MGEPWLDYQSDPPPDPPPDPEVVRLAAMTQANRDQTKQNLAAINVQRAGNTPLDQVNRGLDQTGPLPGSPAKRPQADFHSLQPPDAEPGPIGGPYQEQERPAGVQNMPAGAGPTPAPADAPWLDYQQPAPVRRQVPAQPQGDLPDFMKARQPDPNAPIAQDDALDAIQSAGAGNVRTSAGAPPAAQTYAPKGRRWATNPNTGENVLIPDIKPQFATNYAPEAGESQGLEGPLRGQTEVGPDAADTIHAYLRGNAPWLLNALRSIHDEGNKAASSVRLADVPGLDMAANALGHDAAQTSLADAGIGVTDVAAGFNPGESFRAGGDAATEAVDAARRGDWGNATLKYLESQGHMTGAAMAFVPEIGLVPKRPSGALKFGDTRLNGLRLDRGQPPSEPNVMARPPTGSRPDLPIIEARAVSGGKEPQPNVLALPPPAAAKSPRAERVGPAPGTPGGPARPASDIQRPQASTEATGEPMMRLEQPKLTDALSAIKDGLGGATSPTSSASAKAVRIIAQHMRNAGLTPDMVEAELVRRARNGTPLFETAAEFMGPQAKSLQTALGVVPGPSKESLQKTFSESVRGLPGDLMDTAKKTTGHDPAKFYAEKAAQEKLRLERDKANYAAVQGDPLKPTLAPKDAFEVKLFNKDPARPELAPVAFRPAFQSYVAKTLKAATDKGDVLADELEPFLAKIQGKVLDPETGKYVKAPEGTSRIPDQPLSVRAINEIGKRIGSDAADPLLGKAEKSDLLDLQEALRTTDFDTGLGKVREQSHVGLTAQEGFDAGRDAFRKGVDIEEVGQWLGGHEEVSNAYMTGMVRGMADSLANQTNLGGLADAANKIAATPLLRDKLTALLPKTKAGKLTVASGRFLEVLQRISAHVEQARTMYGNSATAMRHAAIDAAEEATSSASADAIDLIGELLTRDTGKLYKRVGDRAKNLVTRPSIYNPKVNEALGNRLGARGPEAIRNVLDEVRSHEANRAGRKNGPGPQTATPNPGGRPPPAKSGPIQLNGLKGLKGNVAAGALAAGLTPMPVSDENGDGKVNVLDMLTPQQLGPRLALGLAAGLAHRKLTNGLKEIGGREPPAQMTFGGAVGARNLAKAGEMRPQQALEMAERMRKEGASYEDVRAAQNKLFEGSPFAAHPWGADGKPKFEISDHNAKLNFNSAPEHAGDVAAGNGFADQVIDHPELFNTYPELSYVDASAAHGPRRPLAGNFNKDQGRIWATGASPDEAKGAMLHELGGHGPQDIEGFGGGGSPLGEQIGLYSDLSKRALAADEKYYNFLDAHPKEAKLHGDFNFERHQKGHSERSMRLIEKLRSTPTGRELERLAEEKKQLSAQMQWGSGQFTAQGNKNYEALAGENEAEAIRKRADLTPDERRYRPVTDDFTAPMDEQIVRFGSNGPQAMWPFKGKSGKGGGEGPPLELPKSSRVFGPGHPDDLGFITTGERALQNLPKRLENAQSLTADQWRAALRDGGASKEGFTYQIEPALSSFEPGAKIGRDELEEAMARHRTNLREFVDETHPGKRDTEKHYSEYVAPGKYSNYQQELITGGPADYKSHNWNTPGVIGHIRTTDRVTTTGEKVRHVEELQSDLHQEGAKYGYRDGGTSGLDAMQKDALAKGAKFEAWSRNQPEEGRIDSPSRWPEIKDPVGRELAREAGDAWARFDSELRFGDKQPPAAPLQDWEAPFVQRALLKAAQDGRDLVTFPTSQTLHEAIGNEGVNKFYDERLPKTLEKVAKAIGAKVETARLPMRTKQADEISRTIGQRTQAYHNAELNTYGAGLSPEARRQWDAEIDRLKREYDTARAEEKRGYSEVPAIRLTPEAKERLKQGIVMSGAPAPAIVKRAVRPSPEAGGEIPEPGRGRATAKPVESVPDSYPRQATSFAPRDEEGRVISGAREVSLDHSLPLYKGVYGAAKPIRSETYFSTSEKEGRLYASHGDLIRASAGGRFLEVPDEAYIEQIGASPEEIARLKAAGFDGVVGRSQVFVINPRAVRVRTIEPDAPPELRGGTPEGGGREPPGGKGPIDGLGNKVATPPLRAKPSRLPPGLIRQGVGAGMVGASTLFPPEADPQTPPEAARLDDARKRAADIRAEIDVLKKGSPTDVQNILKRQGFSLGKHGADGNIGTDTGKAILAYRTKKEAELADVLKEVTALENQAAYAKNKPNAGMDLMRDALPKALFVAGLGLGGGMRYGAVKSAAKKAGMRVAEANVLLNPNAVTRGASAAAKWEYSQRFSNINDFWRQGGAGGKEPFDSIKSGPNQGKWRANPGSAPPSSLFPPEGPKNYRTSDIYALGGSALDVGISTPMMISAQKEVDDAQDAVRKAGSPAELETALGRLERAKTSLAISQTLLAGGVGLGAGRLIATGKLPYKHVRPNMAAAENERALLLKSLK